MSGNKAYCNGCRDDFYNRRPSPGFDGATECWSLKKAKVVKRYRLGWWTQPLNRKCFTEVATNSCHHAPGQYALLEKLPQHVLKAEAEEKRKAAAAAEPRNPWLCSGCGRNAPRFVGDKCAACAEAPLPDEMIDELNAMEAEERDRERWEAEHDEYGIEVNETYRGTRY